TPPAWHPAARRHGPALDAAGHPARRETPSASCLNPSALPPGLNARRESPARPPPAPASDPQRHAETNPAQPDERPPADRQGQAFPKDGSCRHYETGRVGTQGLAVGADSPLADWSELMRQRHAPFVRHTIRANLLAQRIRPSIS